LGNDLGHPGETGEVRSERGRICRGRDDVEVADGLSPPADASCLGDLHGSGMGAQLLDGFVHRGQHAPEERLPLDRLARLRKRGEHLLLGLRAEPLHLGEPPLLGGRAQVVFRLHPELDPELSRRLGPRPGTCMTSTRPVGSLPRSLTSAAKSPLSVYSTIFPSIVAPIPESRLAFLSSASCATGTADSRMRVAARR
jgi:hypothetical protein